MTRRRRSRRDPALPGRIEAWVPGIRVFRTYERDWLSRDLIAGIVLVTLLVPQGMAYAELAGLPPITGLYTTVVCLIAYALVGPSPVLVLGPDSSLGPMIAATILPLAAGDEQQAIALAGDAGAARRAWSRSVPGSPGSGSSPTCSRTRSGPATWPASRSSSWSASCPKLFGFSTDAEGLVDEFVGVPPEPRPDERLGARDRPAEPRHHPRAPARRAASARDPRRRRRLDRAVASSSIWPPTACRSSACCRRASRSPSIPTADRVRPAAPVRGRHRHLARRDRRHHLDVGRLRRAARLRGQRQPGARRDRVGQPRRRALLGLPGQHQRLADGRRATSPARRPS